MNVLVTGGAGFIGTRLVSQLGRDDRVVVLDDLSATGSAPADWEPASAATWDSNRPTLVVGDIRDAGVVESAATGADAIVHLAAQSGLPKSVADPRHDFEVNAQGTLNVLEAARHHGVGRVVIASSGAVVGEWHGPISERAPTRPVSPYGASKLAAESYASAYWSTWGIETVALRFSNAYGPGSAHKTSVIAEFCRAAIEGRPLVINGDGTAARDFVFVDDVVSAIRAAISSSTAPGEVFQVATGVATSINSVAHIVVETAVNMLGLQPDVCHEASRLGDVPLSVADTEHARRELGFEARVGLADGIRETLAFFRDRS